MKKDDAINTEPNLKGRISGFKSISVKSSGIPGLIFIILIIVINPFISCTDLNSPFYNKVLNDFDTTSYFIALYVKSPAFKGHSIIENNKLYLFLHKTKGFNNEKYKSFMKSILTHHRALKIKDEDFFDWQFIKVYEMESVIKIANQGRDNFVAHYFDGIVLNYGITDKERNAIINQLFYWDIAAKIDKATGDLIIG